MTLFDASSLSSVTAHIDPNKVNVTGNARFFDGADTTPADTFADNWMWRNHDSTHSPGDANFIVGGWHYMTTNTRSAHLLAKGGVNNLTASYFLVRQKTSPSYQWTVYDTPVSSFASAVTGTVADTTWYFLVAYHDADNDEIGIYLDGTLVQSTSHSLGIYSADATSKFVVGANGRMSGGNSQPQEWTTGQINRVFTCQPTVSVSTVIADLVKTLYNNGRGLMWEGLLNETTAATRTQWGFTAGKGSYYNLTEASGAGVDSVASLNLTDSAAVTFSFGGASSIDDTHQVYKVEDTISSFDYEQTTYANQPTWNSNGALANQQTLSFDGSSEGLVYTASQPHDDAQGMIAISFRYPNTLSGNVTLFESADTAGDVVFFRIQILGATKKINLHSNGTADNSITFTSVTTAPDTNYTIVISSDGSNYHMYYNGSESESSKTVVSGSDDGAWLDNVTGRDVVTIGMGQGSSGDRNHFEGEIGEVIISSDANAANVVALANIESPIRTLMGSGR
jgi:hypothetical protein